MDKKEILKKLWKRGAYWRRIRISGRCGLCCEYSDHPSDLCLARCQLYRIGHYQPADFGSRLRHYPSKTRRLSLGSF